MKTRREWLSGLLHSALGISAVPLLYPLDRGRASNASRSYFEAELDKHKTGDRVARWFVVYGYYNRQVIEVGVTYDVRTMKVPAINSKHEGPLSRLYMKDCGYLFQDSSLAKELYSLQIGDPVPRTTFRRVARCLVSAG